MGERTRIEWIDYAKTLGIWLVILGHILNAGRPIEAELHTIVYSFHMPFFFLVSGLLFGTKDMSFGRFVMAKIKTLIIPYILLNVLCLALSIPLYLYHEVFPTTNLHDVKSDLLTLVDGEFGSVFAPPSWFLITLFCVMIMSYFIIKLKVYWQIVIVCIAIALTYLAERYEIPLNLDTIPPALAFFTIGNMLKGRLKDLTINRWLLLLLFVLVAVPHAVFSLYNGDVAINHIVGKTTWLFWIVAIMGIVALYSFANILSAHTHTHSKQLVRFMSNGTILILCLHETLINYTIDFFLVNHSFHIPLVLRELILATAILTVCVPFIYLIRRYVPIMLGNRK